MKYEHITEGRFIERPNRFIAHVEINGQVETDRKSTRLNSSHIEESRMPSSA